MTTLVRLLNMFDRFYFETLLYTDCQGNICDAVCHSLSDGVVYFLDRTGPKG